jgi:DNA-binding beta-propeller fold protein YncE
LVAAFLSPLITASAVLVAYYSLKSTADAGHEQARLSLQGQISDRFTAAIDQIGQEGAGKIAVRLGGIYALEGVMNDSNNYERNVVEVLCAYVSPEYSCAQQTGGRVV